MNASRLDAQFLWLLQLVSPALPVGAYSYSEGLETLVNRGIVGDRADLYDWLTRQLSVGAIRIEAAVMVRAYNAIAAKDWQALARWNDWLSAARETVELRQQSWQMGRALMQLLGKLRDRNQQSLLAVLPPGCLEAECNFAATFALAAVLGEIALETATLAYLHSWAANLVSAGVRLVPLGQTDGQQLLLDLQPHLLQAVPEVLQLPDDNLYSCSWGLALASMAHEVEYARLFRS